MRVHLQHVRAVLAQRPATKPTRATRRAELLGYLDDYIAKGITPVNWNLPWRTPVFIDDDGAICAVGYLIERSVGRALPERIAATHKFDYLEDIAKAMPEVASWIEASGLTLDELASIQPGYSEPEATTWQRWHTAVIPDGEYMTATLRESPAKGHFKNHKMQGAWTTYASQQVEYDTGAKAKREEESDPVVVGRGTLRDGAGPWTSLYPDGKLLAEGQFANNDPNGTWRFFHKSGNLAATGQFAGGTRVGRWQFFHDSEAKTPIATGSFSRGGYVTGRWRHYGTDGTLIAISHQETPWQWRLYPSGPNNGEGEVIDVVPGADRIQHTISVGTIDQQIHRLDTFALGNERIYVYEMPWLEGGRIYDAAGNYLEKTVSGDWGAADCNWSAKHKRVAKSGDVAQLHGLLFREVRMKEYESRKVVGCGTPKAIDAARSKRIDALLASRTLVRAQTPQFVRDLVLQGTGNTSNYNVDDPGDMKDLDLVRVITQHMSWYVEWPHIDGRFVAVFRTLPGHVVRHWYDKMMGNGEE